MQRFILQEICGVLHFVWAFYELCVEFWKKRDLVSENVHLAVVKKNL